MFLFTDSGVPGDDLCVLFYRLSVLGDVDRQEVPDVPALVLRHPDRPALRSHHRLSARLLLVRHRAQHRCAHFPLRQVGFTIKIFPSEIFS